MRVEAFLLVVLLCWLQPAHSKSVSRVSALETNTTRPASLHSRVMTTHLRLSPVHFLLQYRRPHPLHCPHPCHPQFPPLYHQRGPPFCPVPCPVQCPVPCPVPCPVRSPVQNPPQFQVLSHQLNPLRYLRRCQHRAQRVSHPQRRPNQLASPQENQPIQRGNLPGDLLGSPQGSQHQGPHVNPQGSRRGSPRGSQPLVRRDSPHVNPPAHETTD